MQGQVKKIIYLDTKTISKRKTIIFNGLRKNKQSFLKCSQNKEANGSLSPLTFRICNFDIHIEKEFTSRINSILESERQSGN